jgi:hypothetical protein
MIFETIHAGFAQLAVEIRGDIFELAFSLKSFMRILKR